jgi:hypothetical protein
VVGLPPFVVSLAATNPPAAPFAVRRPFVITAVRKLPPAPPASVEMMIVPLKPFWPPLRSLPYWTRQARRFQRPRCSDWGGRRAA